MGINDLNHSNGDKSMNIMEKLGISSDKWVNYAEDDFEQITWTDEPQCTKKEWEIAKAELQTEYESKQYQRDRSENFPSFGDQLDYIFHHGIEKWKTDIVQPVKDKFPKPT